MNCIITYKGSKYTQEQFKEYISNHKNEFSHVIASNKNVIDSFKRKMEGIDFVFSQSPELASIGGKAQYLQYLSTIFKTSKVKDIVYHGTNLNFDKFDKTKIGGNTAVKGEKPSFSFSDNKQQAEAYSSEITVGQNTNELAEAWFEENQHVFKNGDITTGIIDINNVFDHYKKELEDSKEMISPTKEIDPVTNKYKVVLVNDKNLKELSEIKTKEWQQEYNTLLTAGTRVMSIILNIKNPKIIDFKGEKKSAKFKEEQLSTKGDAFIAKNIDDWGKGDVIQVFEPEQIHILGSKQDIENFANFVNKDNESKYLVDPNQLPIDFEGANKIREAEIKLTKARAEWDLFCKVSIKDKATAVSHSNEALYNVYPALKRDYPNLDIKIEKHHVRGYYTITVFNPDVKYFRNREGLDEYGNIIIPKFLTSSKIKDKASDKKNPFGEIVIRNQSLIKILESRLSDAKLNSKQASEIKAKISRLENQIEKIIEVNKLSAILDVGSNQAIELTKRLSSIKDKLNESDNIELDDLRTIISSLVDIKYYIDIWEDLNEVFDVQIDDDHLMQTSELVGKYDGLKNTYATLLEKALIEYFNKESYGTFSRNEVFGSAVDTSYMTMQLQGIQHSDTELLRIANDIIKKSLFDINSELISKSKSINDMTDKLVKLFPGKELDTFKKFLQYDKNGNWTGNLVTENSQAYYDKLRELGKLRKNKKLSYAQWLEAVGKMQHRMTKEIIDNNDTTYFTQEEINAQKEMLQIYERDKIAERESLLSSGELDIPGEDRIDDAELERRMLDWDKKNNPYLYWENIKEGNFKNLPKRAYRYILEPKARKEWHDKGYEEVMNNETLREFYLFMVKTFTDNNKVFPQNYKPNQKNYLPELNKSFAEELSKDRGLSMIKGIPDAMINAITTEVNGNIDFNINIGGKVIKSIPIHMMSDRLDTNEKSIDLRKIMLAHTAMSLNYKHKAEILPIIQAIQDRLDDMVETTLNTTNTDYKRTIFGVKQNLGKRLNNTKKHLEHTIDTWIFNNNKDTSFVAKQGMFLTKEEKETKKQLRDKLDAREITQDEYDEQVNKLGKHLSADEIGDSLIRYTYLKALSFPNVVSPAVNMFFGVLSNLNYAAGGVDFTDKEIIESTGIMMRSISKTLGGKLHSETIEKVYAWMEKMKLLGDINESMYGKEKTIADKLVILQMKAEVINQGSVMIAMLKNKKVKDLQGNDVSLWNAYKVINGELVWDKEKLGEQPEEVKDKIIEGNAVNLYRLSNQIKAVVKRIHGDYENPLRIKRNVLGRMLILFKTWLPATLKERFGKLDYDQDLGRDIKGRYISIFNSRDNSNYDINFHKSLATFAKLILTQNFLTKNIAKKSLNEYSAVDAENLRRAARESQVIIALMIVGLLLKSIDTDDDEEKQALNLLINTLGKTNADLMFFFNPGAMMNVGSNPIPPLKTLTDFLKIVPVTYNTLTGNPRYENGPWKDHLRYEKWTYINIPWMVAPAVKMISLADKQYDYSGVE